MALFRAVPADQASSHQWVNLGRDHIAYNEGSPLAETQSSTVYLAKLTHVSGSLKALKVYKEGYTPGQWLHYLQNKELPNVIKIWKVRPNYVITELGDSTLADHISRGISSDDVVRYAQCITRGMKALLDMGLLHGDIKPDNILLSDETVKLCDLDYTIPEREAKATELRVGTLQYMAPEMLIKWQCSQATDVWSFGITLFELFFNKHPFEQLNLRHDLTQAQRGQIIIEKLPQVRKRISTSMKEAQGTSKVVTSALLAIMNEEPSSRPLINQLNAYFKKHAYLDHESTCSESSDNPQVDSVRPQHELDVLKRIRGAVEVIPVEAKKNKQLLQTIEDYLHHQGLMDHKQRVALLTEMMTLCHHTLNRLHRNFKRLGQTAQQVDSDKYELYQNLHQAVRIFEGPKSANSQHRDLPVSFSI